MIILLEKFRNLALIRVKRLKSSELAFSSISYFAELGYFRLYYRFRPKNISCYFRLWKVSLGYFKLGQVSMTFIYLVW